MIKEYFKKTQHYSTGRFILEMLVLSLLPKLFLFLLASFLVLFNVHIEHLIGTDDVNTTSVSLGELHWFFGLIVFGFITPFIETITSQYIPIIFVSFITDRKLIMILFSTLIFSIFHFSLPILSILLISLSGVVYAWTLIRFKSESHIKAILVTTVIHSLYNLIAISSFYFLPEF